MTLDDTQKNAIIAHWLEKADEALEGAKCDFRDKRYSFAISRAYFGCFYAVTAVFLKEGEQFSKHTGVRSALHRLLVKTGRIPPNLGQLYDRLFENRHRADYKVVKFEQNQVKKYLADSAVFINKMKELLEN